jgi:hypothetical protein
MPTRGAIVNHYFSPRFVVTAAFATVALLGAASAAHARGEVQVFVGVQSAPVHVPTLRVYEPAPVYPPGPVYVQPAPVYGRYPAPVPRYDHHRHDPYPRHYRQPSHWDHDGDGVPNRYDRLYNPRWDVDGDGIPNRRDPVYDPRWGRDHDRDRRWHDRQGWDD